MYQTDYIMRTVKQFSEMLAALLFGAKAKGGTLSFGDLDELSLTFTGLTLDTLTALSSSQIIRLFSVNGLDVNKVYASARVLHQLAEQEGSAERTVVLKQKALDLLLEVHRRLGGYLNEEHETLIHTLQSPQPS